MPEDPDVGRQWVIAVVADKFHVLPSAVARDLDEDPEQLSIACLSLLNYAQAKAIFDESLKSGDHKTLDAYQDSDLMSSVRRNTLDDHVAKTRHRSEHPEAGVRGCRLCETIERDERAKERAKARAARAREGK